MTRAELTALVTQFAREQHDGDLALISLRMTEESARDEFYAWAESLLSALGAIVPELESSVGYAEHRISVERDYRDGIDTLTTNSVSRLVRELRISLILAEELEAALAKHGGAR